MSSKELLSRGADHQHKKKKQKVFTMANSYLRSARKLSTPFLQALAGVHVVASLRRRSRLVSSRFEPHLHSIRYFY